MIPVGPDGGVLVVADGMGGAAAGEQAAGLAIRAVKRAVERVSRDSTRLRTAIMDGFEQANQWVLELGIGTATTLAASVKIRYSVMRTFVDRFEFARLNPGIL